MCPDGTQAFAMTSNGGSVHTVFDLGYFVIRTDFALGTFVTCTNFVLVHFVRSIRTIEPSPYWDPSPYWHTATFLSLEKGEEICFLFNFGISFGEEHPYPLSVILVILTIAQDKIAFFSHTPPIPDGKPDK